jgi:hypothetical protein
MDVREAVNYRTWKVRAELKLGTFQLDQSNKGSILPFQKMTTTTPTRVCQNGVARTMSGVKGWEEMDLDITLPGIVKIENERWHHQPMRPKSTTVPQPKNKKPTPKKAGQATGPTPPSKAEMFMQLHPGGKLETKGNEMKGAERRVSAKLQKKGSTSAEGRKALDGITTIVANENKENEVADPASTATKRKKQENMRY